MGVVIGWDIGGVHLKTVRAEDGRIVKAAQYASPLRNGTELLEDAFLQARKDMGGGDRNVITMTGELADIFTSRQDGVEQLSSIAERALGMSPSTRARLGSLLGLMREIIVNRLPPQTGMLLQQLSLGVAKQLYSLTSARRPPT